MEKQEIIDSILKTVKLEVTEWVNTQSSIKDPFEYEKNLFERSLRIGRTMLEESEGIKSKDRNQKKILTVFGFVRLPKSNLLSNHKAFKISMYMQSMICLLGQHSVFTTASDMLKSLLNVDVSAKQIQRVSEWYGSQIDPIIEANHQRYIPQLPKPKLDEYTYVLMDGSQLFTREEKWKEIKVGRVFHQSQIIATQENRNEIGSSLYVSHLGDIDGFFPKFERYLENLNGRKVFICDGAKWIWKWIEDNYPGSIQILDYYHAIEKIEALARIYFKNEIVKQTWLNDQKKLLLDDKVLQVIENIQEIKSTKPDVQQAKKTVIGYYTEHEDRMMYKTNKEKGLMIGSGPIESAHRNLVQQRLKLSGQRWSKKGAQAIVNLRAYNLSKAWYLVEDLIKLAA